MKQPRFYVFKDKAGAWRWHLKAGNGRIIAQGESHTRKADAIRAVETVQSAFEHSVWKVQEG